MQHPLGLRSLQHLVDRLHAADARALENDHLLGHHADPCAHPHHNVQRRRRDRARSAYRSRVFRAVPR